MNEQLKFKVKSISDDDEKKLLEKFVEIIRKFDQDNLKLCGHNGKEFDFPYICRRLIVNRIEIPWALDLGGKKPWEVNHFDTLELWKFGEGSCRYGTHFLARLMKPIIIKRMVLKKLKLIAREM